MEYAYDGEGRRVKRTAASNVTHYVYDGSGMLAAEYNNGSAGAASTQYLLSDHLGSVRAVATMTGGITARHDYTPFGEELPVPPRPAGMNYAGADGLAQRFTGKERDGETGLDYFIARHYGSAMTRFFQIDPVVVTDERLRNPQQLNLYAYAANNPLRWIDLNGEEIRLADLSDEERRRLIGELQNASGLTLPYNDNTGQLEVGKMVGGGSSTFRHDLIEAIAAKDVFNVLHSANYADRNVFTGLYDYEKKTVVLNFDTIAKLNERAPEGFNLATIFYHEAIAHGLRQLPDKRSLLLWKPVSS